MPNEVPGRAQRKAERQRPRAKDDESLPDEGPVNALDGAQGEQRQRRHEQRSRRGDCPGATAGRDCAAPRHPRDPPARHARPADGDRRAGARRHDPGIERLQRQRRQDYAAQEHGNDGGRDGDEQQALRRAPRACQGGHALDQPADRVDQRERRERERQRPEAGHDPDRGATGQVAAGQRADHVDEPQVDRHASRRHEQSPLIDGPPGRILIDDRLLRDRQVVDRSQPDERHQRDEHRGQRAVVVPERRQVRRGLLPRDDGAEHHGVRDRYPVGGAAAPIASAAPVELRPQADDAEEVGARQPQVVPGYELADPRKELRPDEHVEGKRAAVQHAVGRREQTERRDRQPEKDERQERHSAAPDAATLADCSKSTRARRFG